MEHDEPVARQQREPHPGAPGHVLARNNPLQNDSQCEKREVQRPDAQNAANVERTNVERADQVFLAQQ